MHLDSPEIVSEFKCSMCYMRTERRGECVLLVILIFSPPAAPSEGEIRMKNEGIIHHNQLYYPHGERNKSVSRTEIFSYF